MLPSLHITKNFPIPQTDVLPVVEFSLEEGITHEEAIKLIHDAPEEVKHKPASATKKERWQEELSDQYQTLKIGNDAEDDFDVDQELGQYYSSDEYAGAGKKRSDGDPFTLTMGRVGAERSVGAQRIIVGRSVLKQLKTSEVLIANHATPLKPSYYRNLVPDMNVTMCSGCHRFFMEDFEASALLEGCCPFCRRNDDITT